MVNEQIPAGEVLLIDNTGKNLGIKKRDEALALAQELDLDLVVVAINANPLVARIMDYPKYKFDMQKKQKEMRKNQQTFQVKGIRLGPTIQENDFQTKLNSAKKFLAHGDKIKITMRFRGRMLDHASLGTDLVNRFIQELGIDVVVEQKPVLEGFFINATVAPTAKKK